MKLSSFQVVAMIATGTLQVSANKEPLWVRRRALAPASLLGVPYLFHKDGRHSRADALYFLAASCSS